MSIESLCKYCGGALPKPASDRYPGARRIYCSSKCGQAAAHQRRHGRRPIEQRASEDRFKQDETGQWWYHFGQKNPSRIRTSMKACLRCGTDFVVCPIKRPNRPMGYCSRKCAMLAMYERVPREQRIRENARRWNGGRKYDEHGYVLILAPDHPSLVGRKKQYVQEHRLVMEQSLGRILTRHETVHHKNGIRDDNRPENLELWAKSHPAGQRIADLPSPSLQHD